MSDLGAVNQKVEGLVDTRMKIFGMRFTPAQLIATFALISAIGGGGYSALLMWQKIEALASLDLGSNLAKFKQFNAKRKFKAAVSTVMAANKMQSLGLDFRKNLD